MVFHRKVREQFCISGDKGRGQKDQSTCSLVFCCLHSAFQIIRQAHFQHSKCQIEFSSSRFNGVSLIATCCRIPEHGNHRILRNGLLQCLKPFFAEIRRVEIYTRDVPAGALDFGKEAGAQSIAFQIACYNGDARRRCPRSANRGRTKRDDHVDFALHKLDGHRLDQSGIAVSHARDNC